LPGCASRQPDNSPTGIVKQFYTWRINSQMTGAPTREQLDGMRPLLSHELQELLQRTTEHDSTADSAGKKQPSFVDGDLFSSISVGPTSFTTGAAEQQDDGHLIPVRFVSAKQLPAINWTDHVKVIHEDGHYVLADIEYANHWQLGGKGTLVKALQMVAKSSNALRPAGTVGVRLRNREAYCWANAASIRLSAKWR
jgi:hypothetical protein